MMVGCLSMIVVKQYMYMINKKKEDMMNESYLPIYNCGSSVYMYV